MTLRGTRVLMAWEHGRNLGHIARLGAVASRFEQAGAQVLWAVPPAHADAVALAHAGHRVHESPRVALPATAHVGAPQSFADILMLLGFAEVPALKRSIAAWTALFDTTTIDRVVLDYAPAAQLAALVAGVPAHHITNGFDAPPAELPLFGMRVRGPMLEQRNRERVKAIDDALDAVGSSLGMRRELSLHPWLAYPTRWYDCIAETDPYGPRNDGVYVGPIGKPPSTLPIDWLGTEGQRRIFVYLRSAAQARTVLGTLGETSAAVICSWPGASAATIGAYSRGGVVVVNRPVDLTQVLPACDVVVNYGSSTLVCQALLAGKPQLMLATDLEKWLVARRVHTQGLGISLAPGASAAEIGLALECLRCNDAMRSRVERVAADSEDVRCRFGREIERIGEVVSEGGNLLEGRLGV